MVEDKSLYYYGSLYHRLIDSITQKHRSVLIERIPENSHILDVGCGTGELALLLHREKQCRVIGIDLSQKMVDFANSRNPFDDVAFKHGDAACLQEFGDDHFEFACRCMVLHELTPDQQFAVIKELRRVAERVVLLDYNCPLPQNGPAMVSRLIESTLGRDHLPNFKNYLASGGLVALLEDAGLAFQADQRAVFNDGCHQVIVVGT